MTVATGNEAQQVSLGSPSAGTFTLTYGGQTTSAIAYNAAASAVQTALRALSSIGGTNVAVSGNAGGPYTVTFQGTLRDTNVAQMTGDGSGLTGGTLTITTPTQGNQAVTEAAYVDISVANGLVGNLEVLPGQVPPAGSLLVDKSDYGS